MAETFECQVCGREVGYGPGGVGLAVHSRRHKENFAEEFGRWPSDYQEVRDWGGIDDSPLRAYNEGSE